MRKMNAAKLFTLLGRIVGYLQENSGNNIKQNTYRKMLIDEILEAMAKIIDKQE